MEKAMPELLLYAWTGIALITIAGLLAIAFRAISVAHDLAKIVLQGGFSTQAPAPPSRPQQPPVTTPPAAKVPTPDISAVDQGLVDFIKKQEGFSAKAYWDFKQWTIGYGTKATSSSEVIDQTEAERRLRVEIATADKLVTDFAPGLPKGIHQALLDLTYNAGSGWEHQSLGAAVKAQKWDTVKADILQYNHAGGQVNAGLTARREAEVKWFDNPL
jgi:GH24 family phage-related lysozyme (muramidase)